MKQIKIEYVTCPSDEHKQIASYILQLLRGEQVKIKTAWFQWPKSNANFIHGVHANFILSYPKMDATALSFPLWAWSLEDVLGYIIMAALIILTSNFSMLRKIKLKRIWRRVLWWTAQYLPLLYWTLGRPFSIRLK